MRNKVIAKRSASHGDTEATRTRSLVGRVRVSFSLDITSADQDTLKKHDVTSRDEFSEWCRQACEFKLDELGGERKTELLLVKHREMARELQQLEERLGDALP